MTQVGCTLDVHGATVTSLLMLHPRRFPGASESRLEHSPPPPCGLAQLKRERGI